MVDESWRLTVSKLRNAYSSSRPLSFVKDAAYAWRQLLVYLSTFETEVQLGWVETQWLSIDRSVVGELAYRALVAILDGLVNVVRGERFTQDGRIGDGRRFVGWSASPWVLEPYLTRSQRGVPSLHGYSGV
jgi:hypothetical protein